VFGLAPSSSGQSSVQLSLYKTRLQQAQREAAQAQAKVQSLEDQTETARQAAAQAQNEARSIASQVPPRSSTAPTLNTQGETTGRLLSVQV